MNERELEFKISENLIDQLREGKCTLIAGPLISSPPKGRLGPPTPAWLAFELAECMGRQLDNYELPWVAQLYVDQENETTLRRWVAERLGDPRFKPTLSHRLVAQLPFPRIVYTAQDHLLQDAHKTARITRILPDGGLEDAVGRPLVLIYGTAEIPSSLKLTQEERQSVFASHLGEDLRSWARSDVLLFLGFTLNDPALSNFYYQLRPDSLKDMPRAYLVGPGASADYEKIWNQHNGTLYSLDTPDTPVFLQNLANRLGIAVDLTCEDPPLLTTEEHQRRDELSARFEYLSQLNQWVESPVELRRRFGPHFMLQMGAELASNVPEKVVDVETLNASGSDEKAALKQIQLGNIEWSQENLELAKVYFNVAIELDPKLPDAYLSLFYLLVEKGELKAAQELYPKLIHEAPQHAFLPERYQIQKILGQNDLGVSYCIIDRENSQFFTATILRKIFSIQEEALAQFEKQMSGLACPRISRFLGYSSHHSRHYILSEYIDGPILRDRLNSGEPLPYLEAMQIAGQIAEALDYGHKHGALNLDLEPANIVLGPQGATLVNYGYSRLSRLTRSSGRLAQADRTDYRSPEQLAGEEGDAASDIYALGTILYEMLVGHTPGVGSFQPPSELNLQVTEAVDVLIDHARARYPAQRYPSAGELRNEINRISLGASNGGLIQPLRMGLAWISQRYEQLVRGKYLLFLLPVLAALMAASLVYSISDGLRLGVRLVFSLLLNSVLVSVFTDWGVRVIARRRGLGSLISSGRGIGACLGLVFTLNLFSANDFHIIATATDIYASFAAILALVLLETALALGIILLSAWAAQRLRKKYTWGFYWSFIVILAIEIFLIIIRQPVGMFYF